MPSLCRPLRDSNCTLHCSRPSRHGVQREDSVAADVEAHETHATSRCPSWALLEEQSEVGVEVPYQQQPKTIDVFVDADFAARETMLRSTSGVADYYGRTPIEFASSTQSVRPLSTGEVEFDAITKGSPHSLHSQDILNGFRVTVEAVVLSDASAGIRIASCQGCGPLKHLEVKWLTVQEKVSEKPLRLRKHPAETNTADLATKYLTGPRMEMLLSAGNLVLSEKGEKTLRTS